MAQCVSQEGTDGEARGPQYTHSHTDIHTASQPVDRHNQAEAEPKRHRQQVNLDVARLQTHGEP